MDDVIHSTKRSEIVQKKHRGLLDFLETAYIEGNAEKVINLLHLVSVEKQIVDGYALQNANSRFKLPVVGDKSVEVSYCMKNTHINGEPYHYYKWDSLILWFQPSMCCLREIIDMVASKNLLGIASIGCGTGLLEWLLVKLADIEVTGYEINKDWWDSKYAPLRFLDHKYVDELSTLPVIPKTEALFCCYFNNSEIFGNYLESYNGPLVIIIGSVSGTRSTKPGPLDFMESLTWKLIKIHQTPHMDAVAFYERKSA